MVRWHPSGPMRDGRHLARRRSAGSRTTGFAGPLIALGTLLLTGACGHGRPREWKSSLDLADFVAHQRNQVSTDLISPPEGVGLDDVGSGWRLREEEKSHEIIAEMRRKLGRLRIYSPEADLVAVEVELGLTPNAGPGAVKVEVAFNLRPLTTLEVTRPWSTYRIEIPPDAVWHGLNVLDLRHENRSLKNPFVRLRRVRPLSRRKRPLWPRRPGEITVRSGGNEAPAQRFVEMPTDSCLDMVLRVPKEAQLTGTFRLEPAPAEALAAAEVSVRLLDRSGSEHSLLQERFEGAAPGPRRLQVELGRWSGELVRLRWRVTGSSNALLRWRGAAIRSTDDSLAPPRPSITRVAPPRSGRLGRPDVIVILLDAARADAFSPLGGPHETPAVARLAADGTVFRQAVAGASWTLPSVAGLLTGLYADTLGAEAWEDHIPDGVPTLPQLMAAAGYKTVLFSQHPFYLYDDSYVRGFTRRRVLGGDQTTPLPGPRDLMARNRPTFTLVHLLPPHAPYTPPAPFRGMYTSGYAGDMTVDDKLLNSFGAGNHEPPSEADVRYVEGRYLENVAYADSLVGRILASLRSHGRYDNALIVLLADHGEAFMEHGRFLHSQDLHHEVLHVPLVVKWPRSVSGFRRVVDEPVSLLDLLPTLVDGLSLSGADHGFQGRSLLPLVFEGHDGERSFYAVTRGGSNPNRAAVPRVMLESGGWSVHLAPLDDRIELYRVSEDPLERHDLATERPLQALLLRQSLLIQSAWNHDLLGRDAHQGGDELDRGEVEQLKALGYLN
jgi:arylsulfatase A-like enzyme